MESQTEFQKKSYRDTIKFLISYYVMQMIIVTGFAHVDVFYEFAMVSAPLVCLI